MINIALLQKKIKIDQQICYLVDLLNVMCTCNMCSNMELLPVNDICLWPCPMLSEFIV